MCPLRPQLHRSLASNLIAWAEKKQGIDGSFQFTLVLSDEQLDELLRDSYHKGHFHPVNI